MIFYVGCSSISCWLMYEWDGVAIVYKNVRNKKEWNFFFSSPATVGLGFLVLPSFISGQRLLINGRLESLVIFSIRSMHVMRGICLTSTFTEIVWANTRVLSLYFPIRPSMASCTALYGPRANQRSSQPIPAMQGRGVILGRDDLDHGAKAFVMG